MNLLNYTLKYLSIALLLVISIWAVLFYFNMIDEVQDSLDDGLENNKMLVIQRVEKDSGIIQRSGFSEHNYEIKEVTEKSGLKFKDKYQDTLMYTLNEEDMEPFRMLTTVFNKDNKYYEMKVVSSTVEEDDLVRSLLYSLIWLYTAILVSFFVINHLLLRRIWTPFYLLLKRLKAFRLDKDQGIETGRTEVKEFKELNAAVESLVAQSVGTYGSQKQFIENAAHELQTPLAISLNRLELLAENEDLSDQHLEAIGQVIGTLQRLTRLNKSLLLLSKIENKQYGEVALLSITTLTKTLISEYEDFAALKSVQVHLKEEGPLEVAMNKDLAAILISNLLKNAITHNIAGGTVNVSIGPNGLVISNTGRSVALDPEKVFKRFKKDSQAQSSTGLGLAIVKAIIDLYGFGIQYSYTDQHHLKLNFR
ncbi:Signal transduction histidine kinase [Pedobacter steynii]|uniref:histidine kinase n=1 Tax=Pedobacter steynii TaxID=430522 RepID=A0A1H0B3W9_9SPHI|nr:HAMP domain-containing sensor histidine kinase [Pedobacter steynii]NQX41168.1 HAMP domain-containing histidine kinase [Pedobacter steynii]SDN40319.1 Signal transduction histidine kinase [Pedobacter steynii]